MPQKPPTSLFVIIASSIVSALWFVTANTSTGHTNTHSQRKNTHQKFKSIALKFCSFAKLNREMCVCIKFDAGGGHRGNHCFLFIWFIFKVCKAQACDNFTVDICCPLGTRSGFANFVVFIQHRKFECTRAFYQRDSHMCAST